MSIMCPGGATHKSVAEVHEWFLHHMLYHIDHKAVPGLPEWFLHNMLLCCEHIINNVYFMNANYHRFTISPFEMEF
jgi:hypothetical protein